MASAWGLSWGESWGNSWGDLVVVTNKAPIRTVSIGVRASGTVLALRRSNAAIAVREIAPDAVSSRPSEAVVNTAASKANVTLSTAE